jgi:hypothetical protein
MNQSPRPREFAVELTIALVLSLSAVVLFAALWSPPARKSGPQPIFVGSLAGARAQAGSLTNIRGTYASPAASALDITESVTITVTATGSVANIIGGPQIEVPIPKGGTVAQLTNRLTDRYPQLQPYAMVALNGGMLPQTLPLSDGQKVELMAPHSAGLTFLGKPLPTAAP